MNHLQSRSWQVQLHDDAAIVKRLIGPGSVCRLRSHMGHMGRCIVHDDVAPRHAAHLYSTHMH
eukprot:8800489-Alexandrium_andersonii.AAC.1